MYIARQPIFDRSMKVYGYELLYRELEESNTYHATSARTSTATVLGGLFELGFDKIVGDKRAFINFNDEFLFSDSMELIAPENLVIEVLEDTVITEELINRIKYLKQKGYRIALDDFVEDLQSFPIVPFADIIKYDILLTPLITIEKDVKLTLKQKKILLAEKIEQVEDYQKAMDMGFQLFQGYFFSKPRIVGGLRSKKTANTIYQKIISELHKPEPSYRKLSEIVETDVNMAYRVMKASKKVGGEDIDKTIKNALTKMGLKELERWINILMLQELSEKKPPELIRLSLLRTKFGELIAANSIFHQRRYEIALMCLFSVIDAMLDQPMEVALEGVLISDDVKEALVLQEGPLMPICNIICSYENGLWDITADYAKIINLKQEKLYQLYLESIKWVNTILEHY